MKATISSSTARLFSVRRFSSGLSPTRMIGFACLTGLTCAIGAAPEIAIAENTRSICLDQDKAVEQRIEACTRVSEHMQTAGQERFVVYLARARSSFARRDYDRALADVNIAIDLFADVAETYNLRGAVYYRKGDGDRAISDYSTAIRLDPSYATAYANRGLAYLKQGAYDFAITDFNEAIRLNPKYSAAYNGRGVALSKKGNHPSAIADFSAAIRLNGSYANAYNNRGIAYSNVGQFDLAITDLEAAIRFDKNNPKFYNELAWTYLRAGNAAAGLPYVDHALRLNPNYASAYDTRGSIYESLGERAKAVEDLKKALSLDSTLTKSTEALRRLSKDGPTTATFSDVVRFVEERGWQVNLGSMCTEFDLGIEARECIFRQVSVQETEGRGDPRGFNVPIHPGSAQYVLLFHLGPLVGEFFIASRQGELIRAYYRTKGAGYSLISNEEVQETFKAAVAYWTDNFSRLKQGLVQGAPR